jgi:predicted membrane protein
MEERFWKTEHLFVLLILMAVIIVYGMITMQYLLAILLIAFTGAFTLVLVGIYTYFSGSHGIKFRSDASTALFVAVFVAFFGMALAPWLVWAVVLMALFLILQSVIRIERQLKAQESVEGDPNPETGETVDKK